MTYFLNQEIAADVENDQELNEESSTIHHVLTQLSRYQEDKNQHSGQKWKLPPNGQPICLFSGNPTGTKTLIRPDDDSESLSINLTIYIFLFRKIVLCL